MAVGILDELTPKFKPSIKPAEDNLTLTHRRTKRNETARENDSKILFNLSVTVRNGITECLRVFVSSEKIQEEPAYWLRAIPRGLNIVEEHIYVYTDGSCINNRKQGA